MRLASSRLLYLERASNGLGRRLSLETVTSDDIEDYEEKLKSSSMRASEALENRELIGL